MKKLTDKFDRVHDYLRVSLTDKCNLNCSYCNPVGEEFEKLRMSNILKYEELSRLIKIFVVTFGIKKVRLTGGEPLTRKNVETLFEMLHKIQQDNFFELGITTNATLLAEKINTLKKYGLTKINVSLDSLKPEKFKQITAHDNFYKVMAGIYKAEELGYSPVKINSVIMKGINDDEILDLVDFVHERDFNIRFIEYMPFTSNGWNDSKFISYKEIKQIVESKYKLIDIVSDKTNVAKEYQLSGCKGRVSFISSISNHFCDGCNRLRITSEGNLKLCLFSSKENEIPLRTLLRTPGITNEDIAEVISNSLQKKKLKHPEIEELLKIDQNNMLRIGG